MRYRQVHLDFHTAGELSGIGREFNKIQFQEALKRGHVDSVTIFSKCHHGYSFHPSRINKMHPGLSFDLLWEQQNACHEIGVKAPIYLSAGFDEKEAVLHPEWLLRRADESIAYTDNFTNPRFHLLCLNTGYLDMLMAEVEEVMQIYHPEGIFLDIASVQPCYCARCRQDILEKNKSFLDEEAVLEQAELVYERYTKRTEKIVRKYSDSCTIFHNGGHIVRGKRQLTYANTHLELESLPTGSRRYDHFPMSASYVMNLGMEYLGMIGKFHTTWGEFGGFKHPNALRYEVGLSLAFGAKCSIGDQLHPLGAINMATYDLIGKAYREVEQKEAFCEGTSACFDVAVLGEEAVNSRTANRDSKFYGDIGANRILLEGKYLYTFIDLECDFNQFRVIILPDTLELPEELAERLTDYLIQGGRILATGSSGLDIPGKSHSLELGFDYLGENEKRPDYYVPAEETEMPFSSYIIYEQGYRIKNKNGKTVGKRRSSYFNRTELHLSSHQNTPDQPSSEEAAIVRTSNTSYISWKIFSDYAALGLFHARKIVQEELDYLLDRKKQIEVTLPDRGVCTLRKQPQKKRYIIHMLFAHTTIRGYFGLWEEKQPIEVIEDIVPLNDIKVTLRLEEKVKKVFLVPQMKELPFREEESVIRFVVPKMECHQMIAVEYQ